MSLDTRLSDEEIIGEEYSKTATRRFNSKLEKAAGLFVENAVYPFGFMSASYKEKVKDSGKYAYFKPRLATVVTAAYEAVLGAVLVTHTHDFSYSLLSTFPGLPPSAIFSIHVPPKEILYTGIFFLADASRAGFMKAKSLGMYLIEGVSSAYKSLKDTIYRKDDVIALEAKKNAEPRLKAKYKLQEMFDERKDMTHLNKMQSEFNYYDIKGADPETGASEQKALEDEIARLREKIGLDSIKRKD